MLCHCCWFELSDGDRGFEKFQLLQVREVFLESREKQSRSRLITGLEFDMGWHCESRFHAVLPGYGPDLDTLCGILRLLSLRSPDKSKTSTEVTMDTIPDHQIS